MDNILTKYKNEIDAIAKSVSISPKHYKEPRAMDIKSWRVYLSVNINGKTKQKKFQSYKTNGLRFNLNKATTHEEKIKRAEMLKSIVIHKIKFNPLMIVLILYGKERAKENYPYLFQVVKNDDTSIREAFEEVYEVIEGRDLSKSRIDQLRQFKNRFYKFINPEKDINELTKKTCVQYLNEHGKGKTNKTKKHEKEYLKTYLDNFMNLDYISYNYVEKVKTGKVKPIVNKPFSEEQLSEVFFRLKEYPVLEFYVMHIYYGLLRLITINRLRCKDVNFSDKKDWFDTNTKTGDFPKVMTAKLKERYKEIDLSDEDKFIFVNKNLIQASNIHEDTRRRYYSNWFKKVIKDPMKLGREYGLNSFRHNAHLSFYKNKSKELREKGVVNWHNETCEFIRVYANKATIRDVETYLRGIEPTFMDDLGHYISTPDTSGYES